LNGSNKILQYHFIQLADGSSGRVAARKRKTQQEVKDGNDGQWSLKKKQTGYPLSGPLDLDSFLLHSISYD
jgi:hypothetical protein